MIRLAQAFSRPANYLLPALFLLLLLLLALSMMFGPTDTSLSALLPGRGEQLDRLVLLELRLPRALLAALVGGSLGLAGAAMQGLLRNPLAEPGLVGVSAGAALGAVATFYSGLSLLFTLALPLGGIAGACLGVLLLYLLAGTGSGTVTLILAGVAVNAMMAALTTLALNLSPNPFAAMEIIFWQLGSVADRSLAHVQLCAPLILCGWLLLLVSGPGLDALTLGEDTAGSLGIRLRRLRMQVVLGTALAVGPAVAVSGVIGFLGLVVPHLLRPLTGHQPRRLLPGSLLLGAVLLLAADLLVRLLPTTNELKLGVITALVGSPFLLLLLYRLRRGAVS